jgi:hypothetical protein
MLSVTFIWKKLLLEVIKPKMIFKKGGDNSNRYYRTRPLSAAENSAHKLNTGRER